MRIVLVTHAPWRGTGYGVPSIPIADALTELEHEVAIFAIETKGGGLMNYQGFPVYLGEKHFAGLDVIAQVCAHFEAELVISIVDPWAFGGKGLSPEVSGVPWWSWGPVDSYPLPYESARVLGQYAQRILTWSHFGMFVLKESGLESKSYYCPLSVDLDTFRPPTLEERRAAKEYFDLPHGVFQIGMIGTSRFEGDRKAIQEQILGYAEFVQGREDVRIILNVGMQGIVNLGGLLLEKGVSKTAHFIPPTVRDYDLADHASLRNFYWACDVLLHASAAEGFGLCIVEALACGLPVIANPVSAMSELITDGVNGFMVDGQTPTWSPHGGWWYRPTPEGVTEALDRWDQTKGMKFTEESRKVAEEFSPEHMRGRLREIFEIKEGCQ